METMEVIRVGKPIIFEIEVSYDGKELKIESTDKNKIFSVKEMRFVEPFSIKMCCVDLVAKIDCKELALAGAKEALEEVNRKIPEELAEKVLKSCKTEKLHIPID